MRAFSRTAALAALVCTMSAAAGMLSPAVASTQQTVRFSADFAPGTIVIVQHQRKLYLMLGDGRAIRYRVAVGKRGKGWTGWTRIEGKYVRPAWSPPAAVKQWNPRIPDMIPGGAPNNPMGERALTLTRSEIAIHGTTRSMRRSIGSAASFGCIRMLNEDVIDLYNRVSVGTPVVSLP
jgi:lipoprotein-anchoring transpeptidase ErfK/SrfK